MCINLNKEENENISCYNAGVKDGEQKSNITIIYLIYSFAENKAMTVEEVKMFIKDSCKKSKLIDDIYKFVDNYCLSIDDIKNYLVHLKQALS